MIKLNYYPGCTIHASAREYEISAQLVLKKFDIELEEIKDWNCCGAIEAPSVDHFLSIALPARNLALCPKAPFNKLIMLCSACQQIHNKAKQTLIEKPLLLEEVEKSTNKTVNLDIEIKHLLYFISHEIENEKIKEKVKNSLAELKIYPYYGCCVDRPSRFIGGDDPNFPHSLEGIIEAVGGLALEGNYKTKCCGGTTMLTYENISFGLTKKILLEAVEKKADCIVVVCPMCHLALENTIIKLRKENDGSFEIPIVYFTQLMGLAFGYNAKELGMERHLIGVERIIDLFSQEVK